MKKIKRIAYTILITMIIGYNIPVYSYQTDNIDYKNFVYEKSEESVLRYYNRVEESEWNKYFKNYSKNLRKNWKQNKQMLKDLQYKTSYARVMFVVDRKGNILSYNIKSSCIPSNDKIFIEKVKQTINSTGNLAPLPANYKNEFIVFTVKFHTNLPDRINVKNIDWQRYGVADIELDKRSVEIILK